MCFPLREFRVIIRYRNYFQGVCALIRIAIVEDDDAYRRQLVDFLKRYESESGESFRLSLFSDGMEIVQDTGRNTTSSLWILKCATWTA